MAKSSLVRHLKLKHNNGLSKPEKLFDMESINCLEHYLLDETSSSLPVTETCTTVNSVSSVPMMIATTTTTIDSVIATESSKLIYSNVTNLTTSTISSTDNISSQSVGLHVSSFVPLSYEDLSDDDNLPMPKRRKLCNVSSESDINLKMEQRLQSVEAKLDVAIQKISSLETFIQQEQEKTTSEIMNYQKELSTYLLREIKASNKAKNSVISTFLNGLSQINKSVGSAVQDSS